MGNELEYVLKKEVKEYKKEMQDVLNDISKEFRENDDPYFSVGIVGSVKRNLVLRKGNSNYDVDFQCMMVKECEAKFRDDLREALKEKMHNEYSFNNSTSVITASERDGGKSFDIAIVKLIDKTWSAAKLDKSSDLYVWNIIRDSSNIYEKRKIIKGKDWDLLRDNYKNLKNDNWDKDGGDKKPSYSLYAEAINNTYNQIINRKK